MDEKNLDITGGVRFSVDAGIINRLGKELVGRAETAVSELVKNSYDADANNVILNFINTDKEGGTLIITDDGLGMNLFELINGFMRLSSSDKIHNPVSPIYKRQRAGKKGIGRFATQRLGDRLTIISKTKDSPKALKLDVEWDKYKTDVELDSIYNPVIEIDVDFINGTKLFIDGLREPWSEPQIKRVFRYVLDLLQPDFLSNQSVQLNIASKDSIGYFNVNCLKSSNGETHAIANLDRLVFDHAIGVIEGYLIDGKGLCEVVSERFNINDSIIVDGDFSFLKDVHFKVYYFIYNYDWYEGFLPKMEYNRIESLSNEHSGIKLYRNGFRVLPYGEVGNDWVNIEKTSLKTSDNAYVPFSNINFFGFVEIVDKSGEVFEETSSREGLIENVAFRQLSLFVNNALRQATLRINSSRFSEKQKKKEGEDSRKKFNKNDTRTTKQKLEDLKGTDEEKNSIIDDAIYQLEESEMLRVLAGIGLNIAEFTHEIRQFIPSFNGSINFLIHQDISKQAKESLLNLKENFNRFKTYTSYLDHTISQNVNRDKQPLNILKLVDEFKEIIKYELTGSSINLIEEHYGYDLFTCPMHPSEWASILYNLYTNSKKAINRAQPNEGKIKIVCGKEKGKVYLEFMDNGDGIPSKYRDRVFDAFFTTSTPASFDASKNESVTGTGLGLKIVKDIIIAYNGIIEVIEPEVDYKTCFKIEIPEASTQILEQYGY